MQKACPRHDAEDRLKPVFDLETAEEPVDCRLVFARELGFQRLQLIALEGEVFTDVVKGTKLADVGDNLWILFAT